jgi:hypothetical protein
MRRAMGLAFNLVAALAVIALVVVVLLNRSSGETSRLTLADPRSSPPFAEPPHPPIDPPATEPLRADLHAVEDSARERDGGPPRLPAVPRAECTCKTGDPLCNCVQ